LYNAAVIQSYFLKHKKWPEFLPTIRGLSTTFFISKKFNY